MRLFPAPRWFAAVAAACLLLLRAGPISAQPPPDPVAVVEAGLEAGDPDRVLDGAAARVEVVLFGQGGMYRRAQASHVLRDFFRRHPPDHVSFPPSERSTSDEGRTAIGRYYVQDGGAPLGLRVLHRSVGDGWELASIRVERLSVIRTGGL